ncbi:hypothetical protein [Paludisphaera mucosa]|uniref:Uncharacterized protein n=1 Tax=Paludisphaera mucosa TaxID=3030827 RepID=A0ABT6FHX1_9BACT|nr:hypothetical protein [Paludisphaera mucosa]MDG3007161.1 hypothetical protein [Paludisphaera mucosa]
MIGFRELVLIAAVALALYGRSGVLKSDRARAVLPWLSPVRRGESAARRRGRVVGASLTRGNRLFWALTLLAAAAVVTWIVARTLIVAGPPPPP